eukprot:TRINITY_DN8691_c0_g1_i3.p1 TRINITY_DN8691_c0_g1~~TRINITY_DN8691_c0_g1_i3.p1  ORF type:complete len:425 (+),score=62.83 TRINITY_DN8691_c0_g1_i3:120-1394(+)
MCIRDRLLAIARCSAEDCLIEQFYAPITTELDQVPRDWDILAPTITERLRYPHRIVPYTSSHFDIWDALAITDQDVQDPESVQLIYAPPRTAPANSYPSGWNREHLFPRSWGLFDTGADFPDLHNLRASDPKVNGARGNLWFDDCSVGCITPAHPLAASDTSRNGESFTPPVAIRGDVARAVMYMALRYDGADPNTMNLKLTSCPCLASSPPRFGNLSTLLRWHREDPPDAAEVTRNLRACNIQGNRNPFVDFPDLSSLFESNSSFAPVAPCAACIPGSSRRRRPQSRRRRKRAVASPACLGSLAAGDLAVIGLERSSLSTSTLVLGALATVTRGQCFRFTDNSWDGTALRANEGTIACNVCALGVSSRSTGVPHLESRHYLDALSALWRMPLLVECGLVLEGGWKLRAALFRGLCVALQPARA